MKRTKCLTHRARHAFLVGLAGALLAGCGASNADSETSGDASTPIVRPDDAMLRRALHADFAGAPDSRSECLGRLVFDVPRDMQWGISRPGMWSGDRFRFTEDMHGGADYVGLGNVKIVVLEPAGWDSIESMQESIDASKHNGLRRLSNKIETYRGMLEWSQALLADPSLNVNNEDLSRLPQAIEKRKRSIADLEANIAGIEAHWHPFDVGVPQSLGYEAGPTLYAFLLRDGRAYRFMATGGGGAPPFEERKRAFLDMLQRFRPRALYEVPGEPGICIPYGFIPDDGTGHFRTEVSLRFTDRPGVIYTLGTAVVGEQNYYGEAPLITATARAGIASGLGAGRAPERVGPRQVKLGALTAWQGGVSLDVADTGQPPVRNYSVYTGYPGHRHSHVLPAIAVNMRSFTREQEPTLDADPPPFEESLQRLDELLQSIRLRPTDPPMPELRHLVQ